MTQVGPANLIFHKIGKVKLYKNGRRIFYRITGKFFKPALAMMRSRRQEIAKCEGMVRAQENA